MKRESGITLLVLVVTIALLIIIGGTTINMVLGEDGFLRKSSKFRDAQEERSTDSEERTNKLINEVQEIINK